MAFSSFDHEATLLACARGDHVALQELYRHEAPRMLALCTILLGHPGEAEETVRDAFVLIWKNASNYEADAGAARAWIYSILRYRALNRLRQGAISAVGDHAPADFPSNVAQLASGPASNPLTTTLAQLSEAQRRPVLMAFYEGLNYEQIAQRLALPVSQVESEVRSALSAIAEHYQA